jgi:hypothetical protein
MLTLSLHISGKTTGAIAADLDDILAEIRKGKVVGCSGGDPYELYWGITDMPEMDRALLDDPVKKPC